MPETGRRGKRAAGERVFPRDSDRLASYARSLRPGTSPGQPSAYSEMGSSRRADASSVTVGRPSWPILEAEQSATSKIYRRCVVEVRGKAAVGRRIACAVYFSHKSPR